jgi:citrate synthase
MTAGLAAAVLAVGQYTLAPADTARFAVEMHDRLLTSGVESAALAEQIVQECRASKRRIPGLGHPVFKTVDPRAQKLKTIAIREGCWGPVAQFFEQIHAAFSRIPGKESIPLNDVGMMALILAELGFTPEEMTGLAIISTLPGVVAHISEELRDGRPIRIAPRNTVSYDDTIREFDTDWRAAGWLDA